MRQWSVHTASPEETRKLGCLLGEVLNAPAVILLSGDLGAGKTCFVQGLARGLGVGEEEPVTSPSYALMNRYRGRLELNHFDLYRLSHPDETLDLGLEEYLHGDGVTVLEWAERLDDQGLKGLRIHLVCSGESERTLIFHAEDKGNEVLLERLVRRQERGKGE